MGLGRSVERRAFLDRGEPSHTELHACHACLLDRTSPTLAEGIGLPASCVLLAADELLRLALQEDRLCQAGVGLVFVAVDNA